MFVLTEYSSKVRNDKKTATNNIDHQTLGTQISQRYLKVVVKAGKSAVWDVEKPEGIGELTKVAGCISAVHVEAEK